jgi:cytochrome c oxidase cbb3-type subunit I/II
MADPTSTSSGSIMPAYPWFLTNKLDTASTPAKIRALQTLGTPYEKGYDKYANEELRTQAIGIADGLRKELPKLNDKDLDKREIVALIAYLQRLGTDIKKEEKPAENETK